VKHGVENNEELALAGCSTRHRSEPCSARRRAGEIERQTSRRRFGELFTLEYDLLLYDVTSTYFEGLAERNPLAQRGYSRDHRPDCKQVCIALVVTREGIPVGYEVFAGNRHDVIVEQMEGRFGLAALDVQPDLFVQWCIIREWGTNGGGGPVRLQTQQREVARRRAPGDAGCRGHRTHARLGGLLN
jgi:hypothetical protein